MRTPARPRLPDGDCVFISDARIVARADAPFIAADMTWLGFVPRPLIINFIRTPPTFIRTCADECGNPIP